MKTTKPIILFKLRVTTILCCSLFFSNVYAASPTITASPDTVSTACCVTVNVQNGPGNTTDWVALYKVGAADNAYESYQYLSGTGAPPTVGKTSATLTFVIPQAIGQYEFRFWASNGFTLLAKSNVVTRVAPANPPAIPLSLFSMHIVYPLSNWPTSPIGGAQAGAYTEWPCIESSRGVYDWSVLDSSVNAAIKHNVNFAYRFGEVPKWALSNQSTCIGGCGSGYYYCYKTPDNLADLDNFCTALVQRYKGKIKIYGISCEPDANKFDPSDLAVFATHVYNAIRANDSSALIAAPSLSVGGSPTYLQTYYQAGGPTGVDINSLNFYTQYNNSAAAYPEYIQNWWSFFLPIFYQYTPHAALWNMEGSMGIEASTMLAKTPDQIAAFVARWHIISWSFGITRSYWFAWDGEGTLMPSILGSNVPAKAFEQTENWLVGRTMTPICSMTSDSTWTCGLSGNNGYQGWIVWNMLANKSYTPPNASTWTQYKNLAGDSFAYSGGPVTIGIQPILFENPNSITGTNTITKRVEIIKISPNPAQDKIYFETLSPNVMMVNVSVFSIEGKLLITKSINLQKEKMMDVSSLSSGMYFIQIIMEQETAIQKLIIRQ